MLLPLTVGAAVADALSGWSRAPIVAAAALLYLAWGIALFALLVLRPMSFSVLRIAAPAALFLAVASARSTTGGTATLAIAHSLVTLFAALSAAVAQRCMQAGAYGTERRFALRVPPLFDVVLVFAVAFIASGLATGPLLLADQRWIVGAGALAVGWPLAFALARSVHSLAQRFIVLVPAGLVVADALTLADPVLLPRERIVRLRPAGPESPTDAIDTRLGAVIGGIRLDLDEPGAFARRRGARNLVMQDASTVFFTPIRATTMLRAAAAHRLTVSSVDQAATTPPPSNMSAS